MHDHEILAIHEPTYRAMREVLELHARGVKLTADEGAARAGLVARAPAPSRQTSGTGALAIIPLVGFMSYRPSLFSLLFGGSSTAAVTAEVRRAANDPNVSALLIVTDSPGGSVDGIEELAAAVADVARQKRVTAVADVMAASAAYWAISGASEIVASPSALLGSVGVLAVHTDLSKALDEAGIKQTYIVSSPFKAEGNPAQPLGEEARAEIQRRVNQYDHMMTARIAAGRRVSVDRVRSDFGQGRIVLARDAVARGLADRIGTFEDTLTRLLSAPSRQASADTDPLRLRAAVAVASRRTRPDDAEALRLRAKVAEAARR